MQDTHRPRTMSRRETIRLLPLGASLVTAVGASAIAGTALAAVTDLPAPAARGGAAVGMTPDMQTLAADHFAGLVGETFTVGADAAVLREVRRGPKSNAGFRDQFAIVFDAPRAASAALTPLPVSHPAIGRHDLLVTQIGGATLEICFA